MRRFLLCALGCAIAAPLGAQGPILRSSARAIGDVDVWVTHQVRRPAFVEFKPLHAGMEGLSFVGGPGVIAGTALLAFNTGDPTVNRPALVASMVATGVEVGLLKAVFGRARPYATADSNAASFGWNRGWKNESLRSLPSGHSAMAFAFAGSLACDQASPKARKIIYGGAAAVALSRIYLDKHWLTDVLVGGILGKLNADLMNRHVHVKW